MLQRYDFPSTNQNYRPQLCINLRRFSNNHIKMNISVIYRLDIWREMLIFATSIHQPDYTHYIMIRKNIIALALLSISTLLMAGGRRVLFIGDSITDGAWGNSNVWNATTEERDQKDMNHIYGHGYMMLTASYYEANYPEKEWTFWNRGISGNTLNDLAGRWQKDVLALQPDVLSILVGTNDVEQALNEGRRIDTEAWKKQFSTLLDAAREQNPQIKLVLCTPFVAKAGWRGDSENFGDRKRMITELTGIIQELCNDYQATLVPFDKLVEETIASTPSLPTSYWIWDAIHPTPAMHYRMAEMWKETVNLQ